MLKIEELEENGIYQTENEQYIFQLNGKLGHKGFIVDKSRYHNSNEGRYKWAGHKLQETSEENKHWFRECFRLKKFISKEEALKTFNAVPKYIECIKDLDSFTIKGRIFKTGGDFRWSIQEFGSKNLDWDSWCFKWNDSNTKEYFQPSTEAAYLSQFNKQEENDFNVGDWVYFIGGEIYETECWIKGVVGKVKEVNSVYLSFETVYNVPLKYKDSKKFSNNKKGFRHAKLEEIPMKDLTDEERLEVCKKYFPIGTVVDCPNRNQKNYTVKDHCIITKDKNSIVYGIVSGANTWLWLSTEGWAKIVSKPSVAESIKPHQEAIAGYYKKYWEIMNNNNPNKSEIHWEIITFNYNQVESDTIIIKNRNKSVDLQTTKRPKIQFQQENLIKL